MYHYESILLHFLFINLGGKPDFHTGISLCVSFSIEFNFEAIDYNSDKWTLNHLISKREIKFSEYIIFRKCHQIYYYATQSMFL